MIRLEKFSGGLIFLSTILIALQTYTVENALLLDIFDISEYVIILLFTIEFIIRLRIVTTRGEIQWLIFDGLILFASIVATFVIVLDYGEFIFVARLIRVFRLFRLFGVNSELKSIQNKIFWTFKTVSVFLVLLSIVIFVYSIIGVILFEGERLGILDFRSIHQAFLSLFIVLIDGFSDAYSEVLSYDNSILGVLYISTFALISALIALNVFIAVLTNQVWDKFQAESDRLLRREIREELKGLEKRLSNQISELNR